MLHRLSERGLMPASVARATTTGADDVQPSGPGGVAQRLPTPTGAELAMPATSRPTLSWLVLAVAGVLAVSILLGMARPRAARSE